MKFNWVNVLATLLIIGGVVLLIEKRLHNHTTRHVPTVEEAKADIQRQIETKMGRPLSDAEAEMIDVSKTGESINITLHQPLTGRLMKAIHDAKAATQASNQAAVPVSGDQATPARGPALLPGTGSAFQLEPGNTPPLPPPATMP